MKKENRILKIFGDWRDKDGKRDLNWMRFARTWARPTIIFSNTPQTT